jgi:hypothetical protein
MTTEAKNLYNFLETVQASISDIDRAYCESRGCSCDSCPLNVNTTICLTNELRASITNVLNALDNDEKD